MFHNRSHLHRFALVSNFLFSSPIAIEVFLPRFPLGIIDIHNYFPMFLAEDIDKGIHLVHSDLSDTVNIVQLVRGSISSAEESWSERDSLFEAVEGEDSKPRPQDSHHFFPTKEGLSEVLESLSV
jgi:hypothetical protein